MEPYSQKYETYHHVIYEYGDAGGPSRPCRCAEGEAGSVREEVKIEFSGVELDRIMLDTPKTRQYQFGNTLTVLGQECKKIREFVDENGVRIIVYDSSNLPVGLQHLQLLG